MKCLPTALILFPAYLADAQYSGCAIDAYYSRFNLNSYSRNNKGALRAFMGDLLYATHRGIIPNTNTTEAGVGDTWAALMDLDVGSSPEKIKLLYSLEEIASKPFGGSRGWVKELLHPISRGVGLQGPDVSDLHNLRPVTYLSDLVRADKYFGECGHLVPNDTCEEPAEGGADGTCSCNRVYTPPAEVKGDIARALMYMDLRYDGRDEDSINLRLTDCPFQHERDMAYLSQMLTWHKEDPVDDAEIERNNKVCEQYQGNRNPFVDFPSLADKLWDEPLPLPAKGEREIYEACEKIPTQSPTSDPNQCEFLSEGDIYIWLINSEDPDNLGLFTFEDLEEDFDLFMTTNPWNGTAFVEQGGTVAITIPEGGLDGGTAFGFGEDLVGVLSHTELWRGVQGGFSLPEEGLPIFLYCLDNFEDPKPLLAFTYGDAKFVPPAASYAQGESTLPDTLGTAGLIKLPAGFSNGIYSKVHNGYSDGALKELIRDPNSWTLSADNRYLPSSVLCVGASFSIMATIATLVVCFL